MCQIVLFYLVIRFCKIWSCPLSTFLTPATHPSRSSSLNRWISKSHQTKKKWLYSRPLSEMMLLQLSNLAGLCVFLYPNTCIVMGLLSYSSYFIHSHIKYWRRLQCFPKCRRRFTMLIFIWHQNSTFRWPSLIRQLKVAPSSLQAKYWLQLDVASPVEL